jgi:hypothetical protein
MMVFRNILFCISFVLLLIPGCSSVKGVNRNTGEAIMYGMVYDGENIPVSGATVIVDGSNATITDTQGRFLLSSKQRKEFTLSVIKTGYETATGTFQFEPMNVIHLVMLNAEQLVKQAEFAMSDGRFRDVVSFCDRVLVLDSGRIDASYLKALGLVRLGKTIRQEIYLKNYKNV